MCFQGVMLLDSRTYFGHKLTFPPRNMEAGPQTNVDIACWGSCNGTKRYPGIYGIIQKLQQKLLKLYD